LVNPCLAIGVQHAQLHTATLWCDKVARQSCRCDISLPVCRVQLALRWVPVCGCTILVSNQPLG